MIKYILLLIYLLSILLLFTFFLSPNKILKSRVFFRHFPVFNKWLCSSLSIKVFLSNLCIILSKKINILFTLLGTVILFFRRFVSANCPCLLYWFFSHSISYFYSPIVHKSVEFGALVDPCHFQGQTAYINHSVFDQIIWRLSQ